MVQRTNGAAAGVERVAGVAIGPVLGAVLTIATIGGASAAAAERSGGVEPTVRAAVQAPPEVAPNARLDAIRADIAAAVPAIEAILGQSLGGPPPVTLDTPEASREMLTGSFRSLADRDPSAAAAVVDVLVRAGLTGRLVPGAWTLAVVPGRVATPFGGGEDGGTGGAGGESDAIRQLMVVHDVALLHALRYMQFVETIEGVPGEEALEARKATAVGIALYVQREYARQVGLDAAQTELEARMFAGVPDGPVSGRDPELRFRSLVLAGAAFVELRCLDDGTAAIQRMFREPPLVTSQLERPATWDLPVERRSDPSRLFRGFGQLLGVAAVPGTVVVGAGGMAAETVADLGPEPAAEVAEAVSLVRTWYAVGDVDGQRRVRSASLFDLRTADDQVLDHMVAVAALRSLGGGSVEWDAAIDVPGLAADRSRLLRFTIRSDDDAADVASGVVAFARRGTRMAQLVLSVTPPSNDAVGPIMQLLLERAERGDDLVPVAPRPPGIVSDAVAAIEASLSDADWARDESAMDAIEVASLFAGNL
ncbi:MAG: hypothetical protein AB8G96_03090, partial [Phycisphaerales bacterium]